MSKIINIFDYQSLLRNRKRSFENWSKGSFLKRIASKNLSERLKYINHNFDLAIDYGANKGELSDLVLKTGKIRKIFNVEFIKDFSFNQKKKNT